MSTRSVPRRGDVYYLDHPKGDPHWHVVVSRDEMNQSLDSVLVVPLTSVIDDTGRRKDERPYDRFRICIPNNQFSWEDGERIPKGQSLARVEWTFAYRIKDLSTRCGHLGDFYLGRLTLALAHVFKIPVPRPALVPGPIRPPLP